VLFAFFVSFYSNDLIFLYKTSAVISVISLILYVLFSGGFVNGDRYGVNLLYESKEDQMNKVISINKLLLFGLPNFIATFFVYCVL
jgi:hypothetical protein